MLSKREHDGEVPPFGAGGFSFSESQLSQSTDHSPSTSTLHPFQYPDHESQVRFSRSFSVESKTGEPELLDGHLSMAGTPQSSDFHLAQRRLSSVFEFSPPQATPRAMHRLSESTQTAPRFSISTVSTALSSDTEYTNGSLCLNATQPPAPLLPTWPPSNHSIQESALETIQTSAQMDANLVAAVKDKLQELREDEEEKQTRYWEARMKRQQFLAGLTSLLQGGAANNSSDASRKRTIEVRPFEEPSEESSEEQEIIVVELTGSEGQALDQSIYMVTRKRNKRGERECQNISNYFHRCKGDRESTYIFCDSPPLALMRFPFDRSWGGKLLIGYGKRAFELDIEDQAGLAFSKTAAFFVALRNVIEDQGLQHSLDVDPIPFSLFSRVDGINPRLSRHEFIQVSQKKVGKRTKPNPNGETKSDGTSGGHQFTPLHPFHPNPNGSGQGYLGGVQDGTQSFNAGLAYGPTGYGFASSGQPVWLQMDYFIPYQQYEHAPPPTVDFTLYFADPRGVDLQRGDVTTQQRESFCLLLQPVSGARSEAVRAIKPTRVSRYFNVAEMTEVCVELRFELPARLQSALTCERAADDEVIARICFHLFQLKGGEWQRAGVDLHPNVQPEDQDSAEPFVPHFVLAPLSMLATDDIDEDHEDELDDEHPASQQADGNEEQEQEEEKDKGKMKEEEEDEDNQYDQPSVSIETEDSPPSIPHNEFGALRRHSVAAASGDFTSRLSHSSLSYYEVYSPSAHSCASPISSQVRQIPQSFSGTLYETASHSRSNSRSFTSVSISLTDPVESIHMGPFSCMGSGETDSSHNHCEPVGPGCGDPVPGVSQSRSSMQE